MQICHAKACSPNARLCCHIQEAGYGWEPDTRADESSEVRRTCGERGQGNPQKERETQSQLYGSNQGPKCVWSCLLQKPHHTCHELFTAGLPHQPGAPCLKC